MNKFSFVQVLTYCTMLAATATFGVLRSTSQTLTALGTWSSIRSIVAWADSATVTSVGLYVEFFKKIYDNMEKIKIKAIIGNVNGGFAYVLNRDIEYTYTKIDEDTIIGEDEGVLKFYKRDGSIYLFGKTAFGGRKFTLKLSDGTEEKCHGQWWDGMSKTARELYDYDNIVDFPSATIDDLQKYYLFYGRYCDKEWLEKLKTEYKGKIYDYNEYRDMIKKGLHI